MSTPRPSSPRRPTVERQHLVHPPEHEEDGDADDREGTGALVGVETSADCPICEESKLAIVTYVFGHRLPASGRCVSTAKEINDLKRALRRHGGEMTAYVVEACPECRWHHLLRVLPVED